MTAQFTAFLACASHLMACFSASAKSLPSRLNTMIVAIQKRRALPLALAVVLPVAGAELSREGGKGESDGDSLPLQPVYRVTPIDDKQRFVTAQEFDFAKLTLEGVAFFAVCTNQWPAGLAPIFMIEKTNRFELRRRPPRGQENWTEALFFALPIEGEAEASKIAGRWDCEAIRGTGVKEYVAWDLTLDAGKVVGRFDQDTQYRFAHLTDGTFRSNRFELRAEYIDDAYVLRGEWREGKLKGEWRHVQGTERGAWEASREMSRWPSSDDAVPLYEWRRLSDNARRYALEGEDIGPGWERSPQALCRVWRK